MQSPSLLSSIAHVVGAPVLMSLERFSYYGCRAVLIVFLQQELGMADERLFALYSAFTLLTLFTPLLGGGLAVLTGPYLPIVVGGLMTAAGYGLLTQTASVGPWASLVLMALGTGLVRPCAWAAAGLAVGPVHLRSALLAWLYMTVNLAALFAPLSTGLLSEVGFQAVFLLSAVLSLGVPVVAALLWLASRASAGESTVGEHESAPEPNDRWLAAGIAVVAMVLAVPYMALLGVGGTAQFDGMRGAGLSIGQMGLQVIDPITVSLTSVGLCVALVVAHALKVQWPGLILAGLAMVAAAFSVVALHPWAVALGGIAPVLAGMVGLALTEAVVSPLVIAVAANPSHGRWAALLVAGWFLLGGGAAWAADALAGLIGTGAVLVFFAVAAGLAGVVLAGVAASGRRWLVPPEPEGV